MRWPYEKIGDILCRNSKIINAYVFLKHLCSHGIHGTGGPKVYILQSYSLNPFSIKDE